jgi:hypothetical protein
LPIRQEKRTLRSRLAEAIPIKLTTSNEKKIILKVLIKGLRPLNISVSIAAAITAYSRIHMSQFKNNPDFKLYYSDTDSIDIDKPLNEKFIGKYLGQMKLENIFTKIVYLAPKVYGGINKQNKEYIKVKGLKTKGSAH